MSKTKTENLVSMCMSLSIEKVKKEVSFPGTTNSDLVLCSKNHAASERQKGSSFPPAGRQAIGARAGMTCEDLSSIRAPLIARKRGRPR
jgi:hypothetical protein